MAQVATEASVVVPHRDAATVFDYATNLTAVPEYFVGYGPIPAIQSIAMVDDAAPAVGAARAITLTDGSMLREEIVSLDRPRRHAYAVTGYAGLFSRLVRVGHGEWTFSAAADGTVVTWRYVYELTSPWAWPLAWPLVKWLMRGAMQRALARIAKQC